MVSWPEPCALLLGAGYGQLHPLNDAHAYGFTRLNR